MKVYEKIREMSLDELLTFLRSLDSDANYIYCRVICNKQDCNKNGEIPCQGIDELKELLITDYDLIKDLVEAHA